MTFDEWWNGFTTREQGRIDKYSAMDAYAAGKREAAEHILDLWRQPWGVSEKSFAKLLKAYVEELK